MTLPIESPKTKNFEISSFIDELIKQRNKEISNEQIDPLPLQEIDLQQDSSSSKAEMI